MKMRVKIEYVEGNTLDELRENVNKALEAIQLNVKNSIMEVKTFDYGTNLVAQIAYAELEEIKEPLMEGEQIDVSKN